MNGYDIIQKLVPHLSAGPPFGALPRRAHVLHVRGAMIEAVSERQQQ